MGALYKDTCHADAAAAAAAMCADQFPRATFGEGDTLVTSCTGATPTALTVSTFSASAAASTATSVPVSFPVCDQAEHYTDLLGLWTWGLVLLAALTAARMAVQPLYSNQ